MAALTSLQFTRKIKQLLSAVLMELPKRQAEKFHADLMLEGYTSYLKYLTQEKASMMVSDHEVYEAWYKKYSQARAETVGSIMGNHVGRGKYLTEEIC